MLLATRSLISKILTLSHTSLLLYMQFLDPEDSFEHDLSDHHLSDLIRTLQQPSKNLILNKVIKERGLCPGLG